MFSELLCFLIIIIFFRFAFVICYIVFRIVICFALLGHDTHPKYKQGQKIIAAYKAGILFE